MPATLNNTGVLFNNGSQQNTAYTGANVSVFTSSGSITIPTGIQKIKITAIGAGGGCSGSGTFGGTGQGGGGGGTSIRWLSVTAGEVYNVTVGSGGSGGGSTSSGSAGGLSGVSTGVTPTYYARANGGNGGIYGGSVGSGGTSDSGDINFRGCDGGRYYYAVTSVSGSDVPDTYITSGGGTFMAPSQFVYSSASAGLPYGGGAMPGTSGAGASGGNGVVIIEY